jgi:hypothetical protein
MKIRPVGAELFHADGQTDTMKLIVAFSNFANASKMHVEYYPFVSHYTTQSVMLSTPLSYLVFPGFEFRSDSESRCSLF